MDYFTTSNEGVKWSKFLLHRFEQMLVHGLSMTPGNTLGSVMTLVGFGMVWYYLIKNRYQAKQIQRFLSVVFWLYGGYWLVALLFRGELWSYYYGPFISLMAMALVVGLVQVMGSRLTWGFIIGLVVTNLYAATPTYAEMDDFVGENELSWRFYQQMSKDIAVKTSGRDFGFFAYTPDQYGYQPRYAIQWLQKSHNGTVFGYQKKALTLLVIAPAPNNKPELDGVWWTQEQVRIEKSPTEIVRYGNGYRVEYYNLTEAEQGIQTDPNLIDDLVFR
jgi:hypothetical protein